MRIARAIRARSRRRPRSADNLTAAPSVLLVRRRRIRPQLRLRRTPIHTTAATRSRGSSSASRWRLFIRRRRCRRGGRPIGPEDELAMRWQVSHARHSRRHVGATRTPRSLSRTRDGYAVPPQERAEEEAGPAVSRPRSAGWLRPRRPRGCRLNIATLRSDTSRVTSSQVAHLAIFGSTGGLQHRHVPSPRPIPPDLLSAARELAPSRKNPCPPTDPGPTGDTLAGGRLPTAEPIPPSVPSSEPVAPRIGAGWVRKGTTTRTRSDKATQSAFNPWRDPEAPSEHASWVVGVDSLPLSERRPHHQTRISPGAAPRLTTRPVFSTRPLKIPPRHSP